MISRTLEKKLIELSGYYPVVVVTGPRQSGKTTLCRMVFPQKPYVSLEAIDTQEYARTDPRGFLKEYEQGAIIDEIQHAPDLLSYLQTEIDANPESGRFILTGSQHFGLSQSISQSLAGRCGILVLLPPSLEELRAFPNASNDLFSVLFQGAYPRIFDQNIPAHQWLADYTATYIQRDVRQVINVGDLQPFSGFLKLCAGRTAQEINLSALGSDAGVSHNTIRSWLSVLETSYIVHRLPPWHVNIRKQVVKTPKLHFFDSGLVCYLLGIREPEQLRHHPHRGAIFESWVIAEIYKNRVHGGGVPRMFHYRETRGIEMDLLIEQGGGMDAVEIKSGATLSEDFFKNLDRFSDLWKNTDNQQALKNHIVYGGDLSQKRSKAQILSWRDVSRLVK
ncbi:MAG: AAA family ATPase [Desulfobacterales bacterium CG23_combo_of_CG06-09_8_20_14_all_51_8]|nr:MAG: AAA family ATPase [Desulfobacterales bacterium CG23_combo_of_CG06-09_8_20_14_all_51_8]